MKLATVLLTRFCLSAPFLVGACGNFVALEEASDAGLVDAPPVDPPPIPDAVPAIDADPSLCNLVTQEGCAAGQKCAQLVEVDDPFTAVKTCVPDGTVPQDGACSRGPAGPDGFDDCIGGLHCIGGSCSEICDQGPPDTCQTEAEPVFEGATCTLFANLFEENLGLCVPACDPTDDAVVSGALDNADCPADQGCYLNFTSGATTCAVVPADAIDIAQNETCFGPGGGSCFLNGCASGFAPLLQNDPADVTGTPLCARFCTPQETHLDDPGRASGFMQKCETTNLQAVGGTNGASSEHQCRFIQTLYLNGEQVPAEAGICVPALAGTYGDCTNLNWEGIKSVWNAEAPNGQAAADAAFNNFCFATPGDPSTIFAKCVGFFRGCISVAEKELGLDEPIGP